MCYSSGWIILTKQLKFSTAATGIEYKDVNKKVATYEMLGEDLQTSWHFTVGNEPIVKNTSYVVCHADIGICIKIMKCVQQPMQILQI